MTQNKFSHSLTKKLSQSLIMILGVIIFIGLSSSIVNAFNLIITPENNTRSSLDTSQLKYPNPVKNLSKLQGLWRVDYERSLEEARKNPNLSAEEIEKMPQIIRRLMERMQIEITENSLIYKRGTRETTILCSVQKKTETKIIALCNNQNQEATLTFTLIDNNYLNFKSSTSDDMNYYIWKRVND